MVRVSIATSFSCLALLACGSDDSGGGGGTGGSGGASGGSGGTSAAGGTGGSGGTSATGGTAGGTGGSAGASSGGAAGGGGTAGAGNGLSQNCVECANQACSTQLAACLANDTCKQCAESDISSPACPVSPEWSTLTVCACQGECATFCTLVCT